MRRYLPIATVLLPVAILYLVGGLEVLERLWMDAQFRLSGRQAHSNILLVDIDRKSLEALEVFPWPRGYHATVVEQLLDAGAYRIGFDIEFSSRSGAPEEDAEFELALKESKGRVVLPIFQEWQHTWPDTYTLKSVEPLPRFKRHVKLGTINAEPATDGLIREYTNRGGLSRRLVPGFASAIAGDPRPDLERFYVDFGIDARSIRRMSYVDVLTGRFDPEVIANKSVIIGSTAAELKDQVAVPVDAALPGPLFQALAYESLMHDRALVRMGPHVTLIVALLLVLLLAPMFEAASWRRGLLLAVVSCVVLMLAVALVQRMVPYLFDTTPLLVTFFALYGYSLVRRIDQQDIGLLTQGLAIRRTESLMRNVVENSFDAIVTVNPDGAVETFNRAAQDLFGYTEEEVFGRPLTEFVADEDASREGGFLTRATEAPAEAMGCHSLGRRFPVDLVVTAIETEEDPRIVAVLRDITERKAHQAQLQHQATHDPLTDLPNRFLLHDRVKLALDTAKEEGRWVAIMLLDLDRFKEINDVLGHHTGDLLLQQVARRLETPLHPDETIARLGGDEFAVLLPGTEPQEARRLGWKLIEALRSPFQVERLTLQIDTSVGIAMYPDHGNDADQLIQRADVAMYTAKRKRTGLCVYSPDQDFNSIRHLMLRGDLRSAIEDDLLRLVYQPKISARNQQIVGVEALLRWSHPEHGNIPPDEFIGLAEHSGLIRNLTQWVIRTALRQSAEWIAQGFDFRLSLNLSARNLLEEDLPQTVHRLLVGSGVPPGRLILEITESVIMEDPERALTVVTQLRDLGVGISIDDFGTGYSSLGYLMRLPAHELKIDKSFVMEMERDPGSATIVHSTIDLAHNLGLEVVAEGVESAATWNVLCELGCDIGQGYHFSRPQPAEDLIEWAGRWIHPPATVVPKAAIETITVAMLAGRD